MSEIKHLPKTIPNRDHEFTIKVVGDLTKESYEGEFQCKIPNLKTQSLIAKTKAFYNAGFDVTLDVSIKNLHHMVAYCKHTITKAPEWFLASDYGYDLYDENVLTEIYLKIVEHEEKWLESVWGKKDKE